MGIHLPAIVIRFTALRLNLGGRKTADGGELEPAVIGRPTTRDTGRYQQWMEFVP
jgi:hypothetical protein